MAEIIDLRHFGAAQLEALLTEETAEWKQELDWDFSNSANLVRRYADLRALGGCALVEDSEVAAYGYTVVEETKGLIGDLYVRPQWRGAGAEGRVFRALLDNLALAPHVRRVESQLMLLDAEHAKLLQRERFVRLFERILMTCDAAAPLPPGKADQLHRFQIESWKDHHQAAAAAMLVLAYDGHIDAQINDQYRTLDGASTFLSHIVHSPGGGVFFPRSSFAAIDLMTGWLAGMSLCGFVSEEVAHITQLCVSPRAHRVGLGYELLRRSLAALREAGAKRITLTVTSANAEALQLYQRCGFEEMRRFYAYVWERHLAVF